MASDIFAKRTCTYCEEEIKSLPVKCAECPSFELCLQCFSAGAEIGFHKNDHSYEFIDSYRYDYFGDRSGWTVREELLLLIAIEQYGYGNWEDISRHIETRTPEEARDEYINRYLVGEIGRYTWVPELLNSRCKLPDSTAGLEDDPQAIQVPPPTKHSVAILRPEDAEQVEYTPFTDEFKSEYDNEAEFLVCDLTLSPDDDELDTELKLTQVEMYTQRLRERARRHRVVRDNQLITEYLNNKHKPKKKISREKKEVGDKLGLLWKEKMQLIMAGVLEQRRLSHRLVELMRHRRNGLVKLEEIPHFDQERQLKHSSKPGSAASSIQNFSVSSKKKDKCEPGPPGAMAKSEVEAAVERLSGAHLLSPAETQLCNTLDIAPNQYISMKTLMLAEPQLKVEGDCGTHILDHLVGSGWVSNAVTSST